MTRVLAERRAGRTLVQSAADFTADQVATSTGRPVRHASTVKQVLTTAELDSHAASRRP